MNSENIKLKELRYNTYGMILLSEVPGIDKLHKDRKEISGF